MRRDGRGRESDASGTMAMDPNPSGCGSEGVEWRDVMRLTGEVLMTDDRLPVTTIQRCAPR
jgi:hypothetical protein